jgi:hypothetical protein
MSDKVDGGAKEIQLFSDNCAGQNRNSYVFGAYAFFGRKYVVTITPTFLEVGHTQHEADSVHALNELKKKNVEIYVPSQWYTLTSTAKVTGNPYVVKEVSQSEIYDLNKFVRDTQNNKVK